MTNIDTSLTDFWIAILCLYFCARLWRKTTIEHNMRSAFIGFFMSIAVAGLAGGISHGWYEGQHNSIAGEFWWKLTLMCIGLTSFYMLVLSFSEVGSEKIRPVFEWSMRLAFLAYFYVIAFVRADFTVAVIAYVPAMVIWFLVFLVRWKTSRSPSYLIAIIALLISFIALGIQRTHLTIHPDYLDHNALYHLVQSFGLYILFRFSLGRL